MRHMARTLPRGTTNFHKLHRKFTQQRGDFESPSLVMSHRSYTERALCFPNMLFAKLLLLPS